MNSFCFDSQKSFLESLFWNLIPDFNKLNSVIRTMVGAKPASYASFLQENDSLRLFIVWSMVDVRLHRANVNAFLTLGTYFVISYGEKV